MRKLPRNAQILVATIWGLGALAVVVGCRLPIPNTDRLWEVGLFVLLGALAGRTKVRLTRHSGNEDVASMSLGFALIYATLLRLGPTAGMLVGVVTTLVSCLLPRRQPLYQLLFNLGLNAFETLIAGLIFWGLNGSTLQLDPLRSFPAVMASTLFFFLIDTGVIATAIAWCKGQKGQEVAKLWRETFLWTAPSYFAGACVSSLALILLKNNIATALLFISPVAYLTYQAYSLYTMRAEENLQHIEEKQQHIEALEVSQAHLADLYLATIKSLALAIDAKDQFTHQHILRVQRYAVATAKHMGIQGADLEAINTGALLHDIGKLGVPEYVLLKPGRLTDEEFDKIKKHPEIGAAILDPVEFPWPVLPVVKYHHEKWDGSGYPEGLAGEAIPLIARVMAVADVYDALTSSRTYRNAWSHEQAVEHLHQHAGKHFDPAVVEAFTEIVDSIVEEMAREGVGPLVSRPVAAKVKEPASKADQAVREITRASSELGALYEVAQTLSSSLGLQETLDILAGKLEAIFPGTACLFLSREDRVDTCPEHLVARAAVGTNRPFFANCRTLGADSRTLAVAREQGSYLGGYDPEDLLLTASPSAPWTTLHAALIVPIVHQGEVLGTINLYHPDADAFSEHDRQLLEMIAARAAMALYNGLLFDRTRSSALTDPLTGLYNVRYLTQHVEERCAEAALVPDRTETDTALRTRRQRDRFALLCLDLDSFKPINDNFGHQKGDQVLRDLSEIFRATVRKEDTVARYGGDEFLIVLDNVGAAEAERVAAQLEEAVARYDPQLVYPRLGALRLGVSVGYGCFPQNGSDCATLLSAADSMMYQRKTERKLGQLAENGKHSRSDDEAATFCFARPATEPGDAEITPSRRSGDLGAASPDTRSRAA